MPPRKSCQSALSGTQSLYFPPSRETFSWDVWKKKIDSIFVIKQKFWKVDKSIDVLRQPKAKQLLSFIKLIISIQYKHFLNKTKNRSRIKYYLQLENWWIFQQKNAIWQPRDCIYRWLQIHVNCQKKLTQSQGMDLSCEI